MSTLSRREALVSILGAACSLGTASSYAQQASSLADGEQSINIGSYDKMPLGEVLGASYAPGSNVFDILVNRHKPGGATAQLFVDEVILLTRLALAGVESWAFALEFERLAARPFTRDDIAWAWELARRLEHPTAPTARYLSNLLPRSFFADVAKADRSGPMPGRLRQVLVDGLNHAREDPRLFSLEDSGDQAAQGPRTSDREQLRVNRRLLEDCFSEFLRWDIGPRYQIRYLTDDSTPLVREMLSGSRLELRLLVADLLLKQCAFGDDLPNDIVLGASLAVLCQLDLEERLERDGLQESEPHGRFDISFDLETDYAFPRELGTGFLFKNPRLVVRHSAAEGRVPPCVERFTDALNRNLGRALQYPGPLGDSLRSVKALLMAHQAIQWALRIGVPIGAERVASFRTDRLPNELPEVRELSIVVPYDGGAVGIAYEGGVRFPTFGPSAGSGAAPFGGTNGNEQLKAARTTQLATGRSESAGDPRFIVVSDPRAVEAWVRVDISSILGLGR